jgi:uncharacterized membrane protein YqiK
MESLMTFLPVVVLVLALLAVGIVAAKLYTRSSPESAFVRTGLGGREVVMSGGAVVLPVFHEIIWVNMNTLRLEVRRGDEQSLITQDRLRVDVSAEFYVRVTQSAEAIATAAQTLGNRTSDPAVLKQLIEGKFVDALRSAAATMTMEQLHERRAEFVQNVKNAVSDDLAKNGLELEAVSLTGLNQTRKEFFDPQNAFDAEGLLKLTREIESRARDRNAVEQDTGVAIATKNLEATRQQLDIRLEREQATLQADREVARMTSDKQAEVSMLEVENRRRAEEADLISKQEVSRRRIATEQAVAEAESGRRRAVETAAILAETDVKLAAQDQNVTVAKRSEQEAAAQAQASTARALAVRAEEQVITARAVEQANRQKEIALIEATVSAEQASIGIVVAAEAAKDAAEHHAKAVEVEAQGYRNAATLRAEAVIAEGKASAEAALAGNAAKNLLSAEVMAQEVQMRLLEVLPAIIAEAVRPLAAIESIRIAEVGGLGGIGGGVSTGGESASGGTGSLSSEVVNAALKYRAAAPLVDGLLAQVGLKDGLTKMDAMVASAVASTGILAQPKVEAQPEEHQQAEGASEAHPES